MINTDRPLRHQQRLGSQAMLELQLYTDAQSLQWATGSELSITELGAVSSSFTVNSRTCQELKLRFPTLSWTECIFSALSRSLKIQRKNSRTFQEAWEPRTNHDRWLSQSDFKNNFTNRYVQSHVPWLWTRHCPRLLLSAVLWPRATAARLQSCSSARSGTDRWTDTVPLHRPWCSAHHVDSANSFWY